MPDIADAPEIYSKYIVKAKYQWSPNQPALTVALMVNADIAVPRFKSKGATNNVATSVSSLTVQFQKAEDVTSFAQFWGAIGEGEIHFTTDKKVIISGPIERGPKENQAFVGMGTWVMS